MSEIAKRISTVLKNIQPIAKDKKHEQGWEYASAPAIKRAVRPVMGEAGLSIVKWELLAQKIEVIPYGTNKVRYNLFGDFEFTLGCTDSDETTTIKLTAFVIDYSDKVYNKLYTQALKNFLINTFLLDDGGDDETDYSEAKPERKNGNYTPQNYTPQKFLNDVNERLRGESLPEYKKLSHLAQVIGDGTWPLTENREAWIKAGKAAIQHKAEEPFLLSIIEKINGFDDKKSVKAAIAELEMEIVLGDENAIESLTATLSDYATEKFFTEEK